MPNDYRMSYFMPPIAPIKDKQGQILTSPTLSPFCEVCIEQVFQMITSNEDLRLLTEQVRNAPDIRIAKTRLLPYVTPCGTFSRRSGKYFLSPSGLVIVDLDHFRSYRETEEMRRVLHDDPLLRPSGLGVKAFVPTYHLSTATSGKQITECMSWAMQYVETAYNTETSVSSETKTKVDFSGKDLVRSCFLSHDPEALFRNI